jgi:hypothetical protein
VIRWYLFGALFTFVAVLLALDWDRCPEHEDGAHYDLLCFRDTDAGQVAFHRCLHCLRETAGIETPWLRRRTHPTPGRVRR